jgi:hypothetical protein
MQTKTQQPHNQKNNQNGPKHVKPPVPIREQLNSECDDKLLPSVTAYVGSVTSALLCLSPNNIESLHPHV